MAIFEGVEHVEFGTFLKWQNNGIILGFGII